MQSVMRRCVAMTAVAVVAMGSALAWAQQAPGPVERAGERLDEAGREAGRKLDEAGRKLRRGFEKGVNNARGLVDEQFSRTRDRVHEMNVASRIYGRLHWDKLLVSSPLELTVEARGVVTLRGMVPNEEARKRAVQLAVDTVGVERVVDQLAIQPAPAPTTATDGAKPAVKTQAPAPVDETTLDDE